MKEVLKEGVIGKPVMVDASVKWFRDQEYYDSAGWRGTLSLDGGGALINQAVHTVDLMLWLCGDVESVKAYTATLTHERMEGEDNAVAAIRFENGAIGVFKASTSVVPAQSRKIEVHCEKGTAVLDGDMFSVADNSSENNGLADKAASTGASSPMEGMTGSNHQKQYEQILSAFRENQEPVVSGRESLKSLAFVRAVYESAEQQQTVNIKEFMNC
jgi:predicted dehydrogenase